MQRINDNIDKNYPGKRRRQNHILPRRNIINYIFRGQHRLVPVFRRLKREELPTESLQYCPNIDSPNQNGKNCCSYLDFGDGRLEERTI